MMMKLLAFEQNHDLGDRGISLLAALGEVEEKRMNEKNVNDVIGSRRQKKER